MINQKSTNRRCSVKGTVLFILNFLFQKIEPSPFLFFQIPYPRFGAKTIQRQGFLNNLTTSPPILPVDLCLVGDWTDRLEEFLGNQIFLKHKFLELLPWFIILKVSNPLHRLNHIRGF